MSSKVKRNRRAGFLKKINGPSPKLSEFFDKHKDQKIVSMKACRIPVNSVITSLLNAISLGHLSRKQKELGYDKLFHLYLIFTLDDGSEWLTEKNEIVQVKPASSINIKNGECKTIGSIPKNLTFRDFLNDAFIYYKNHYEKKTGINFWEYHPTLSNCQRYVISLINGSKLGSPEIEKFVLQDASTLLPKYVEKLGFKLTNIAANLRTLIFGGNI